MPKDVFDITSNRAIRRSERKGHDSGIACMGKELRFFKKLMISLRSNLRQ